jgi:divalent metal cation (Fe/Co/Zn/Cd) transporter
VILGTAGAALGFPLADPIIGLVISVAIMIVLRDAAKEMLRRLIDAIARNRRDHRTQKLVGSRILK